MSHISNGDHDQHFLAIVCIWVRYGRIEGPAARMVPARHCQLWADSVREYTRCAECGCRCARSASPRADRVPRVGHEECCVILARDELLAQTNLLRHHLRD